MRFRLSHAIIFFAATQMLLLAIAFWPDRRSGVSGSHHGERPNQRQQAQGGAYTEGSALRNKNKTSSDISAAATAGLEKPPPKLPKPAGWLEIRGRVLGPDGQPMHGLLLAIRKEGEQRGRIFLVSDGSYEAFAPPGTARISIFRRVPPAEGRPPRTISFFRRRIEIPSKGGTIDFRTKRGD